MNKIKLNECPFCGGQGKLHNEYHQGHIKPILYIKCQSCYAMGPRVEGNADKAIQFWNERYGDKEDIND